MKYHLYAQKPFTPEQTQRIKDNSIIFDNIPMLSSDEFAILESAFFNQTEYPEIGDVSDIFGFHWDQYSDIKKILKPKLDLILGDYELDFMMFQRSKKPWHVHTDARWHETNLPYTTVIIPIGQEDSNGTLIKPESWKDTYTISFNQSNFYEIKNSNIVEPGNVNSHLLTTRKIKDQEGAVDFIPNQPIDNNDYELYFSHLNKEVLDGLTIKHIAKWVPGNIAFHPQTSYHAASNFIKDGLRRKFSIVLFTKLVDTAQK